jgi:hypothetical protein
MTNPTPPEPNTLPTTPNPPKAEPNALADSAIRRWVCLAMYFVETCLTFDYHFCDKMKGGF